MLDVLITPVKCLQGRTYNGVWMSTQDTNIFAWSLEFCLPQPISMVILLGVEVTVTLHLPQGSMLLKLCPAFWSLQLAHLLGIVHTNIGCCSAPTLASKGQCDALCELKYLCRRVHWGATSGGSAGRMAGDDSSYRGVSPLAKGELGRSSVQPCQCGLEPVSYLPLCDHCHFRLVKTPDLTFGYWLFTVVWWRLSGGTGGGHK